MRVLIKVLASATLFCTLLPGADLAAGKKVFETYCWGCHHQTAVAFGPPFSEIASKRTYEEIEAYIIEPKAMYKAFGHKRSVMPQLKLDENERRLIAEYILSYKGK